VSGATRKATIRRRTRFTAACQRIVRGFTARRVSLCGLVAFLVLVVIEHVVNPSLDPVTHQVSEYVHTPTGAVMTFGFLAWAVSLAALALVLFRSWRVPLLPSLLAVAAAGLVLVASFGTQTVAGELPRGVSLGAGGRLHDLGSGLTTAALLAAAVVTAASHHAPAAFRRRTATLVFIAILGSVFMLAIGASVGGARQRLLILIAGCWQYLLLQLLARDSNPASQARSSATNVRTMTR
jgi:hypothetical protein